MLNSIIKFLLFPNFNEKYYGRKDLVKANLRKKSDERDHKSPKHTPRTKSWQYPPSPSTKSPRTNICIL